MSKLSEDKRELLAYIDAILTMIEKYPTFSLGNMFSNINISIGVNPFDFLLSIITKFVSYEEMVDWLVNFLTVSLPAIELSVKGILLSNLKETIDCVNDPRIPEWMRKNPYDCLINNENTNGKQDTERGIVVNLRSIDYSNILSKSPMSEDGCHNYFGTMSYYTFDKSELKGQKYYSYPNAIRAIKQIADKKENGEDVDVPQVDDIINKSQINSVYELARAKDFNAFLWFAKNKARFTQYTLIEGDISASTCEVTKKYENGTSVTKQPFLGCEDSDKKNILNYLGGKDVNIEANDSFSMPFSDGSVLLQKYDKNYINVLSLCFKHEVESQQKNNTDSTITSDGIKEQQSNNIVSSISEPKKHKYHFAPVSSNWKSANWYVNSGTYFNFLLPEKNRKARDYSKDFPICNIELIDKSNASKLGLYSIDDCVRFTILPAPFIHVPQIDIDAKADVDVEKKKKFPFLDVDINADVSFAAEPIWRYKRLLFNEKGEADKKGHYTVIPSNKINRNDNGKRFTEYSLQNSSNSVLVYWDTGSYELKGETRLTELIECYPGLTVYDFNYNFVMGMQLYDPAVVASQLIEVATNLAKSTLGNVGLGFKVNKTETAYQMRISEIIKKALDPKSYETSDCFFTFSNNRFTELLDKAELKRSNAYNFATTENSGVTVSINSAYDILNEFSDDATLNENKNVITKAINEVTAKITDEVLPSDKYNVQLSLVQELIKSLVFVIVNTLLTPKIVLLFKVNRELLGDFKYDLSLEEFIESIIGLITGIINEIVDLILRELLNWVMSILKELCEKLAGMLALEQIEYYTRILKGLLKACAFRLPKRKLLDSQLDNVDYADIDPIEVPKSDEC